MLLVVCAVLASTASDAKAGESEEASAASGLGHLTEGLTLLVEARDNFREALESPELGLDEDPLQAAFESYIAAGFQTGRAASALARVSEGHAQVGLTAVSTGAFLEVIALSDGFQDLNRDWAQPAELQERLSRATLVHGPEVGSRGAIAVDGRFELALAVGPTEEVVVADPAAGFEDTVEAASAETLEAIESGEDTGMTLIQLAARWQLGLLHDARGEPPASPFGDYAFSVAARPLVFTPVGRESVSAQSGTEWMVTLRETGGEVAATAWSPPWAPESLRPEPQSLEPGTANGSTGRPYVQLTGAAPRYQALFSVGFVSQDGGAVEASCTIPVVGARVPLDSSVGQTGGQLSSSTDLLLAPTQLQALAQRPQVVCLDSSGALQVSQIDLPAGLVPAQRE